MDAHSRLGLWKVWLPCVLLFNAIMTFYHYLPPFELYFLASGCTILTAKHLTDNVQQHSTTI